MSAATNIIGSGIQEDAYDEHDRTGTCVEHALTAPLVLLEVDRTLGEEHSATGFESVEHKAGTVLRDHAARKSAVHDVEHLGGARVGVRRVHAAGAQEPNRHGHS